VGTVADLDAVVHGAAEVSTVADGQLQTIENGAVAVEDGTVAAVGPTQQVTASFPPANATQDIDATGQAVLPGFVDSHTHALFAGDRSDEFEAKIQGTSYQELLAQGGGIHRTVQATRNADRETLESNLRNHLDRMACHGTTTVEVKSGYGLNIATERQMLSVIAAVADEHPLEVVPTFMGAHAVPQNQTAKTYVETVLEEQLPAIKAQGIAEFCDVFCEADAFSVAQSRRVLEAGREHGLTPKIHAEELSHIGGSKLGAEIGATSADHLLHATAADAAAMARADVTPVLLPATAFGLGATYADPTIFTEAGCSPALATDFNPNCHSPSMAFTIALACVEMGMAPSAAVVAATATGAAALDRAPLGTLREGTPGDLIVLDAPSYRHIPYSYGVNRVETVVKAGEPVVEGGERCG
jgi:imidazolonepropionase